MELQTSSKLQEFIQAAKSRGASDEFLAALLIRRDWPADDVYAALGEHWAGLTGVAVPERGGSTESAREAFLYLLAFSTLCCWATALGSAMFTFIDHWFPDPVSGATYYGYIRQSATWQMATLVVAFPIFLLVMRAIVKGNAARPEQLQSGIRKWLTYIALLGTAGTMIGDLIWFLDALLSGEITERFFLKSAVVMIICGGIFIYYLRSLRSRKQPSGVDNRQWKRVFAMTSASAVAAVFIVGLVVVGTPGRIRHQQADTRRVEALRNLGGAIKVHYDVRLNLGQPAAVPTRLTELTTGSGFKDAQLRDPETHVLYEYHPLTSNRYELCATFSDLTQPEQFEANGSAFWRHNGGRTCYALDASKPLPD